MFRRSHRFVSLFMAFIVCGFFLFLLFLPQKGATVNSSPTSLSQLEGTQLIKDIRPGSEGAVFSFSDPDAFEVPEETRCSGNTVIFQNSLYFTADDGTTGCELWRSDGTNEGTVLLKDIFLGSTGALTRTTFMVSSGNIFFDANDGINGRELWKSDGTAEGTALVKDIYPGNAVSSIVFREVIGDTVYFYANDGTTGLELWKSDGTAEGTALVKDVNPGMESSIVYPLSSAVVNDTLFWVADDGVTGGEIWRSDGTTAGTDIVADLVGNSAFSPSPSSLVEFKNQLYFLAEDLGSDALWVSDGTAIGTQVVRRGFNQNGDTLYAADTTLYIEVERSELWVSDGTEDGTLLLRDFGNSIDVIRIVGDRIYLIGTQPDTGRELWKSDGTNETTTLVKDIIPGEASSEPFATGRQPLLGNTLFFEATSGTPGTPLFYGDELWKTDGTEEGTLFVRDINSGSESSNPQGFTAFNGHMYFWAYDEFHGRELWVSDGNPQPSSVVTEEIDADSGGTLSLQSNGIQYSAIFPPALLTIDYTSILEVYSIGAPIWPGGSVLRSNFQISAVETSSQFLITYYDGPYTIQIGGLLPPLSLAQDTSETIVVYGRLSPDDPWARAETLCQVEGCSQQVTEDGTIEVQVDYTGEFAVVSTSGAEQQVFLPLVRR